MEGAVDVAAEGVAVGEGVDGEEEEPGGGWESLEGADDDVAAGAESAEGGAVEVFGALEEGGGGDEVVGHGGEGGLEPFALGLAASAVVEAEGDVAEDGEFAGEGGEDAAGAGAEAAPAMGEDDAAPDGRSLGRTGDDGLDGLAGGLKGACLLLELAGGEGGLHGVRLEKGLDDGWQYLPITNGVAARLVGDRLCLSLASKAMERMRLLYERTFLRLMFVLSFFRAIL